VSLPDLVASDLTAPLTPVAPGNTINVSWRVTNAGTAMATGGWSERLIASRDAILGNSDDVLLGFLTNSGPLGAGNSVDRALSVQVPITLAGEYTLFVQVDSTGIVEESDGVQQTALSLLTVHANAPPVDLVATVTVPADARTGGPVTATWTVTNAATTTTVETSWVDRIYWSADDSFGGDLLLGTFTHTGALAAGASYTETRELVLPEDLPAGTYTIFVVTDATGQVTEPGAE